MNCPKSTWLFWRTIELQAPDMEEVYWNHRTIPAVNCTIGKSAAISPSLKVRLSFRVDGVTCAGWKCKKRSALNSKLGKAGSHEFQNKENCVYLMVNLLFPTENVEKVLLKFRIFIVFLLCGLLYMCENAHASPVRVDITDSLEKVLATTKVPADRIWILLSLSQENLALNNAKALSCALKAYQIAEQSENDTAKLQSMLQLIWIYYIDSEYGKALDYATRSHDLAVRLDRKREEALALDAMGAIFDDFGDKDKSSEYYFEGLKIYEELKELSGMAQASSRIGVLYFKQKNYPKALEYLLNSLELSKKTNLVDGITSNLNSIANVYAEQNDFQKALKNYQEALDIAIKHNELRMEGTISLSIGTTYLKLRQYQMSINHFERALAIFKKLNNQLRIAKCQVQFGEYYLATADYSKGVDYAKEALINSGKMGFRDVELSAAQILHRLSLAMKDTLEAYRYAFLETQLKDSLNSGEKQKMLTKLEAQYQFDKEQSQIAIAQQRKDFLTIILIILLFSGIIILFLIWARQKVKARNANLEKENLQKELEFKNKEMVLNVMSLMKKNEMLADLSEKLIQIDHEATTPEGKETIKKVAKELQKNQEEEIWKEFSLRFKEVHGDFYDKLLTKFPTLGPNDLKLCAFLRLNMSSKDIAALTGQRVSSLETARHRLRQKLGISNADVNLITFLSQF